MLFNVKATLDDASRQEGQYNVPPPPPEFEDLSVSASESGIKSVPDVELQHIWAKANDLLSSGDSVVACPGNKKGFVVASSQDPSKPHIVTPLGSGEIRRSGCPQYSRLSICSQCCSRRKKQHSEKVYLLVH